MYCAARPQGRLRTADDDTYESATNLTLCWYLREATGHESHGRHVDL
jgi:hypothetical protein